jgi:hypothetical protein
VRWKLTWQQVFPFEHFAVPVAQDKWRISNVGRAELANAMAACSVLERSGKNMYSFTAVLILPETAGVWRVYDFCLLTES